MPLDTKQKRRTGALGAGLLFLLVWLASTGTFDPVKALVGLGVAGGLAQMATRTPFWAGLELSPRRLWACLRYLLVFFREMLKSNLAVLGYVYAVRTGVHPKVIHVSTRLVGPRERLALTSTLALTPGTLAIDLDGERIEIHMLDARMEAGTIASVRLFEPLLETAVG